MSSHSKVLRIACPNFSREEVDALRSLIGLLKPYLKRPCVVEDGAAGDMQFVNLDNGDDPAQFGPARRVVGCSMRPRLHSKGTIHRPLRVPEVLAALSEAAATEAETAPEQAAGNVDWSFRLSVWPLDFEQHPKAWWRVLACLMREPRTVAEIAARTALPPAEVNECLRVFGLDGAIEKFAAPRARAEAAPRAPSAWHALANRVGRLLGFAR